jgi:hypothetical protein
MSRRSILKWRKWLIENGWLEKSGERGDDGTFKVPIMTVRRGDVVADISGSDGRKKSGQSANSAPRHGSKLCTTDRSKLCTSARVQTLHPEVEPVKQVDSKREVKPKKQVEEPVSSVISFSSNESLAPDTQTPVNVLSAARVPNLPKELEGYVWNGKDYVGPEVSQ